MSLDCQCVTRGPMSTAVTHSRLRPHPGPRGRLDQQDDLYRHGCVFGGSLTALRYPERELVSVPAREMYYEPVRPLSPVSSSVESLREPGELDLSDVVGKRIIATTLTHSVTIREENAIAALE